MGASGPRKVSPPGGSAPWDRRSTPRRTTSLNGAPRTAGGLAGHAWVLGSGCAAAHRGRSTSRTAREGTVRLRSDDPRLVLAGVAAGLGVECPAPGSEDAYPGPGPPLPHPRSFATRASASWASRATFLRECATAPERVAKAIDAALGGWVRRWQRHEGRGRAASGRRQQLCPWHLAPEPSSRHLHHQGEGEHRADRDAQPGEAARA